MAKKIKDLTVQEIKNNCRKHRRCYGCSFQEHSWLCLGLKNMKKKELEKEVEVDE